MEERKLTGSHKATRTVIHPAVGVNAVGAGTRRKPLELNADIVDTPVDPAGLAGLWRRPAHHLQDESLKVRHARACEHGRGELGLGTLGLAHIDVP